MGVATTWSTDLGAIAAAIGALGTVAAVIVALYVQPLRERRLRPKLTLHFGSNAPAFGFPATARTVHTVLMRVDAASGRRSAPDVEVLLTASYAVSRRSNERTVVLDHRPLPWHESTGPAGPVTRMHLAPGVSRSVELLKVGPPAALHELMGWSAQPPESGFVQALVAAIFAAPPFPPSPTTAPFLPSHLHWLLRFDVTARDVDSATYEVELHVTTRWTGRASSRAAEEPAPKTYADAARLRVSAVLEWGHLRAA